MKKIFSVFLMLAMVGSLCAVTAVPAKATVSKAEVGIVGDQLVDSDAGATLGTGIIDVSVGDQLIGLETVSVDANAAPPGGDAGVYFFDKDENRAWSEDEDIVIDPHINFADMLIADIAYGDTDGDGQDGDDDDIVIYVGTDATQDVADGDLLTKFTAADNCAFADNEITNNNGYDYEHKNGEDIFIDFRDDGKVSENPNILAGDVSYHVSFVIDENLEDNDTIVMTFPEGTNLDDLDAKTDVEINGENPDLTPEVSGETATLDVPSDGFDANEKVDVIFDYGVVDNAGMPGRHTLSVYTSEEPQAVDSEEFILTGFTLRPQRAEVGKEVTAYGAGFSPDKKIVWIYHDGDDGDDLDAEEIIYTTTKTDDYGMFSKEFTVTSNLEQAVGYIDARDKAGNNRDCAVPFDVAASITLDTPSVTKGGEVKFDGINFLAPSIAKDIKMRFGAVGAGWNDTGEKLAAGERAFSDAAICMPFTAPWGSREVTAWVDVNGNESLDRDEFASATIEVVEAALTMDPTEGFYGQKVSARAEDLAPETPYEVMFNGKLVSPGKTTRDGTLSESFLVSDVEPGDVYPVEIEMENVVVASSTFSVTEATLSIDPESGPVGTSVKVTGQGYPFPSGYDLLFEDPKTPELITPLCYVKTTSMEGFSVTVTIPRSTKGMATIRDSERWATATFTVTKPKAQVEVREGLSSVWDVVDESVWYFDNANKNWYQYYIDNPDAVPEAKRLSTLNRGRVYCVYVTKDVKLWYGGVVICDLTEGWNIITWP